jgi:hypothetical protein
MKTSEKAVKLTKSPKVKMIGIATATFLLGVVLTSAGAL